MPDRQYLCIDQKSFYATVECVARGLDPMKTNLVVADPTRSENTICLAVSPSLKALGVKNRCRIKDIPGNIKHIVAQPRMQLYIDCAAEIYAVFLKYIAPEDIHNTLTELRKGQQVTVVYYGTMEQETLQITGTVMKVDPYWQTLQVNKVAIDFSEIYEIIQ